MNTSRILCRKQSTDVGGLSSDNHGWTASCILNVLSCREFGQLLPEKAGLYCMAEFAVGARVGMKFVPGVQLHWEKA